MSLFTFAISSIVDANTGYGLSGTRQFFDIETASSRDRGFVSNSVHGLIGRIKSAISNGIGSYQARAQERRDLAELQRMSDSMLRDIGLHRGDLIAVELGSVSLEQLQKERRGERDEAQEIVNTVRLARAAGIEHDAANEASYQDRKCA